MPGRRPGCPLEADHGGSCLATAQASARRGGDRDAKGALWRIALVRVHCHQRKDYFARRTAEGRTKKVILRCLKRYIAREAYPLLLAAPR
jgi:hypothetical protein